MTKIRPLSIIKTMSGKLHKHDSVYFKTNTINDDVIAVKQVHFPLEDNVKQASEAQKAHQTAFKKHWNQVDTLLQQPARVLYEELYYQHRLACRQRRAIREDCLAVENFLQAQNILPQGADKTAEDIIADLKSVRKPFSSLRTFTFHCLR